MNQDQERMKRQWLDEVYRHPRFTKPDHEAAEAVNRDGWLTDEQVDVSNLVKVGAVRVTTGSGLHTMMDTFGWKYRG